MCSVRRWKTFLVKRNNIFTYLYAARASQNYFATTPLNLRHSFTTIIYYIEVLSYSNAVIFTYMYVFITIKIIITVVIKIYLWFPVLSKVYGRYSKNRRMRTWRDTGKKEKPKHIFWAVGMAVRRNKVVRMSYTIIFGALSYSCFFYSVFFSVFWRLLHCDVTEKFSLRCSSVFHSRSRKNKRI